MTHRFALAALAAGLIAVLLSSGSDALALAGVGVCVIAALLTAVKAEHRDQDQRHLDQQP